ncbi:MAG: MFS transporter [Candidatus Heimdallarchaeota archaeon]|nr:MFS transporter [Candidatus Heimdallarchaeota archaeon]
MKSDITVQESLPNTLQVRNYNHKGILRNIITVSFFYRIFEEAFTTLLIPYAYEEKGWTFEEYGLVLSIGGYASMVVIFILGFVVDIQFKRTGLIIGLSSIIVSAVAFTRVDNFYLSILFYCLFAIGQQLMMISTNAFIANETGKGKERTKGLTWNMVSRGLASASAPIICMYLLTFPILGYDWVFTLMAVFGVVALILVFTLKLIAEKTPKGEIDYAQELSEKSGDDFIAFSNEKKGLKSILLVQGSFGIGRMLMGFTSGVAIPFVAAYVYTHFNYIFEANVMAWAWLNSLNWLALSAGYFLMAFLAEKWGKDLVVVIFWTAVIPAAVGIWLAGSHNMFYLTCFFYILRYFFAMTPSAAWNSFLFEWIPPKHRGKTLGLLQTGQRGMRATGTLIGGLAFSALGPLLFPIAMVAYPMAGLLPLIICKAVKKNLKESQKLAESKIQEEEQPIEPIIPLDDYPKTK